MPKFEGFETCIEIDGKRLEEYQTQTEKGDPTRVVCWIASEAGKVSDNTPLSP